MNKIKNLRRNKKGFTLVEVIVVLVILAILIAIAVPSVMKYIDDANDAKYLAEARAVYVAAEAEVTKDYADDRKINGSIYDGNGESIESEVSAAVGFTVDTIVIAPTVNESLNPNDIESYTVTFDSPSGADDIVVLINKNGTAELQ